MKGDFHSDLEALRAKHGFLTLVVVAVTLDDPSKGGNAPGYTKELDKCELRCSNCHREAHALPESFRVSGVVEDHAQSKTLYSNGY